MTLIKAYEATHIRLKTTLYATSEHLTAGTIHPVTEYEGGAWRIVDPAAPLTRALDWWVTKEVAEAVPAPTARRRVLEGDGPHRKQYPMATGLLDYFPDALAEVARVSKVGNDRHNPGQPMHHARGKSMDHADCIMRHLAGRGGFDGDTRESASLAWRALALLQEELEAEMGLPLPRGARPAEVTDTAAKASVEGTPVPDDGGEFFKEHGRHKGKEAEVIPAIPAFLPFRSTPELDGDTLRHLKPHPVEDAFDPRGVNEADDWTGG